MMLEQLQNSVTPTSLILGVVYDVRTRPEFCNSYNLDSGCGEQGQNYVTPTSLILGVENKARIL